MLGKLVREYPQKLPRMKKNEKETKLIKGIKTETGKGVGILLELQELKGLQEVGLKELKRLQEVEREKEIDAGMEKKRGIEVLVQAGTEQKI